MAFATLGDLLNHLLGTQMSLPIPTFGLFVALAFLVGSALYGKEVQRLMREKVIPKNKKNEAYASGVAFVGMVTGMIGARLFHILEYPGQFVRDPWGMIFSRGGYTILGGLIFAITAGTIYTKRHKLPLFKMYDLIAPILILGYGIGRIGCHLSGDGDWGIAANMALKPGWLPQFLWASTYENNVIGQVILAPGVYPTPLYETLMSFVIFGVLWKLRKHKFQPGWLAALYLFLSGIERLLIEQIRVNSVYDIFGHKFTQAELISIVLIFSGLYGVWKFSKKRSISKP